MDVEPVVFSLGPRWETHNTWHLSHSCWVVVFAYYSVVDYSASSEEYILNSFSFRLRGVVWRTDCISVFARGGDDLTQ